MRKRKLQLIRELPATFSQKEPISISCYIFVSFSLKIRGNTVLQPIFSCGLLTKLVFTDIKGGTKPSLRRENHRLIIRAFFFLMHFFLAAKIKWNKEKDLDTSWELSWEREKLAQEKKEVLYINGNRKWPKVHKSTRLFYFEFSLTHSCSLQAALAWPWPGLVWPFSLLLFFFTSSCDRLFWEEVLQEPTECIDVFL